MRLIALQLQWREAGTQWRIRTSPPTHVKLSRSIAATQGQFGAMKWMWQPRDSLWGLLRDNYGVYVAVTGLPRTPRGCLEITTPHSISRKSPYWPKLLPFDGTVLREGVAAARCHQECHTHDKTNKTQQDNKETERYNASSNSLTRCRLHGYQKHSRCANRRPGASIWTTLKTMQGVCVELGESAISWQCAE